MNGRNSATSGDAVEPCEMCDDECELKPVTVAGTIVKVCPTCRGLLERNGRIEAIAQ